VEALLKEFPRVEPEVVPRVEPQPLDDMVPLPA